MAIRTQHLEIAWPPLVPERGSVVFVISSQRTAARGAPHASHRQPAPLSSTVLTVSQAAAMAGVSTKTIRRWLHSGRLEAGRADEAYVITAAALRAAQDWTPSIDTAHVLSVTPGHVPSTSTLSSELLDRLERQAQRIGQLEAELAQARAQLALPTSRLSPFLGDSVGVPAEVAQESHANARAAGPGGRCGAALRPDAFDQVPTFATLAKLAIMLTMAIVVVWGVFTLHDTLHYRLCGQEPPLSPGRFTTPEEAAQMRAGHDAYERCLANWP